MVQKQAFRSKQIGAGFSLVEVIVVSAVVALVFGGLFAGVRFSIELIGHTKAESGARSLAVARIEYVRSLPYESIGTVGGIPDGPIPQTATTTLNGITYTERVLIQYLDRPEDGFGVDDENGVTEDSKIVKVEYSWELRGKDRSVAVVTDVIPDGIESTSGGGTLFVNIFDAQVAPVAGADVHIYNDTGSTTIDVTVSTNENGIANFPGAPARSGYQITATKDGFSTDQTYSATAENPNPNPPHVSVLEGVVSTVNFAIDALSDLTILAVSPAVTGEFADTFVDGAGLFSHESTAVTGGSLTLSGSAGSYPSSGTAYAVVSAPSALESWQSFDVSGTAPAGTSYLVQLFAVTGSGTSTAYALIPDAVLPGNSAGFTAGPVDITSVDPATYPALALGATLASEDPTVAPELFDWELAYVESQQPIAGVTFDVEGAKTIGESGGSAVPKFATAVSTNGAGIATLADIEWDVYTISVDGAAEGYDIVEAYGILPYVLDPGVSEELTLVLDSHTAHSLRATVVDTAGEPVPGATVRLQNGGYDETIEASLYGQAYFGGIGAATTYSLSVDADGYAPYAQGNVEVSGTTELSVTLTGA